MNATIARLPRLRWSYDNGEALKWIAFACMVVDHANKLFAGGAWAWAVPVGRIAFPLFAFVIARHMDQPGPAYRLFWRLVVVGLVVTPVYLVTLGAGRLFPLNILWTFALVVVLFSLQRWWLVVAAFALLSPLVDYAYAGVFFVLACGWWWQSSEHREPVVQWTASAVLACAFSGLCWFNGNTWALLAVPVAISASLFDWRVPRLRWAFWIGYPAHLVAFALLLWGVGA